MQIFAELGRRELLHWQVRVSCLEVHNEKLRDLLQRGEQHPDLAIVDARHVPSHRSQLRP